MNKTTKGIILGAVIGVVGYHLISQSGGVKV